MPLVEIELTIKVDGNPIPGLPIIRRLVPAEVVVNRVQHSGADGTAYVALSKLATENGFMLQVDQPTTIRLAGQTEAGVLLNAGGLMLVFDGTLAAGANSNLLLNNNSGNTENIIAVEFGP